MNITQPPYPVKSPKNAFGVNKGRRRGPLAAQGIERKSFFAAEGGKKDWSGKPGFLRRCAAKNAPKFFDTRP
jgi:hypothetical protein